MGGGWISEVFVKIKFLAIILFEIRHLQNFIPLFVKWP